MVELAVLLVHGKVVVVAWSISLEVGLVNAVNLHRKAAGRGAYSCRVGERVVITACGGLHCSSKVGNSGRVAIECSPCLAYC